MILNNISLNISSYKIITLLWNEWVGSLLLNKPSPPVIILYTILYNILYKRCGEFLSYLSNFEYAIQPDVNITLFLTYFILKALYLCVLQLFNILKTLFERVGNLGNFSLWIFIKSDMTHNNPPPLECWRESLATIILILIII